MGDGAAAPIARMLRHLLARPARALVPGVAAAVLALGLGIAIGKEFLPELDEGSIWLQVQLPPGLSLRKASEMADALRAATREFPEVSHVVTQLGRNDDGTDSWTPSHIEAFVGLRPYASWPRGVTKHDLIARLSARYSRLPGVTVGFSQPMIDGVNDKLSGAHSDMVIKVFGQDLDEMRRIGAALVAVLRATPGAADVAIDQEPPLPQLRVHVDREAAARYGINVAEIAELIEVAIGGRAVAQIFQSERRYDVTVRYVEAARDTPEAIGNLTLTTAGGADGGDDTRAAARNPLSQVARIELRTGESTITREGNRRHLTVRFNLRGRDLSSFLADAQTPIAREVRYDPQRYQLVWGGQFENQQRAQGRLAVILPVVLTLIFLILYAAFGTLRHAAIIIATVPLALLGGMVALFARGMTLNVSSAVGFIALFGVAVQNGVIMVANLNRVHNAGEGNGDLREAVVLAAGERLRPVLMTATVATLGMLPAALARGIGSDVQRPLTTVVVGGLAGATLLTLLVLPALYYVVEQRFTRTARRRAGPTYSPRRANHEACAARASGAGVAHLHERSVARTGPTVQPSANSAAGDVDVQRIHGAGRAVEPRAGRAARQRADRDCPDRNRADLSRSDHHARRQQL
jgi:cobalt-zinc-cadmium resistance protein CzcA